MFFSNTTPQGDFVDPCYTIIAIWKHLGVFAAFSKAKDTWGLCDLQVTYSGERDRCIHILDEASIKDEGVGW